MSDRYDTREQLLSAAASWMASHHYFNGSLPGPTDDAEMEYKDELLLDAAREFVEAHDKVKTARQIHTASHEKIIPEIERNWCETCKDDPAGQRWLCPNRPHQRVNVGS
jgi:hypothetical protein